jgi:radical SAM protein with 4Fe4S-binding SPASM domain
MKSIEDILENEKKLAKGYSSIKIIAAYKKVLQILDGEIPVPEVVEIFPTNYCNFACSHCRCEDSHGDENQYMDFGAFRRLLEELYQKGIKTLEFSGGGEPLVHPQIDKIFDTMINYNFRLGLITNGYRFVDSDDLVEKALKCSDWIRFSVDAFSDDTYRKVHGKEDVSYTKLKSTIKKMIQCSGPTSSNIGIKMLVSQLNVHELNLAIEEALELKPDYLQFKFLGNHQLELEDRQKYEETLIKKIASLGSKEVSIEFSPSYGGRRKYEKCLLNALHPVIDWNGTVYMCAFFDHRREKHSIGNIHDGGFFNHWGTPFHKEKIKGIDIHECVPNCPISRYDPVVEFIKETHQHFKYV